LQGGLAGFREQILNFRPTKTASNFDRENAYRFRPKASKEIPILLRKSKPSGPAMQKAKRVLGGC